MGLHKGTNNKTVSIQVNGVSIFGAAGGKREGRGAHVINTSVPKKSMVITKPQRGFHAQLKRKKNPVPHVPGRTPTTKGV